MDGDTGSFGVTDLGDADVKAFRLQMPTDDPDVLELIAAEAVENLDGTTAVLARTIALGKLVGIETSASSSATWNAVLASILAVECIFDKPTLTAAGHLCAALHHTGLLDNAVQVGRWALGSLAGRISRDMFQEISEMVPHLDTDQADDASIAQTWEAFCTANVGFLFPLGWILNWIALSSARADQLKAADLLELASGFFTHLHFTNIFYFSLAPLHQLAQAHYLRSCPQSIEKLLLDNARLRSPESQLFAWALYTSLLGKLVGKSSSYLLQSFLPTSRVLQSTWRPQISPSFSSSNQLLLVNKDLGGIPGIVEDPSIFPDTLRQVHNFGFLRFLNLRGNNLTDRSINQLCMWLRRRSPHCLEFLDVSHNRIDSKGLLELARVVSEPIYFPTFRFLAVHNNAFPLKTYTDPIIKPLWHRLVVSQAIHVVSRNWAQLFGLEKDSDDTERLCDAHFEFYQRIGTEQDSMELVFGLRRNEATRSRNDELSKCCRAVAPLLHPKGECPDFLRLAITCVQNNAYYPENRKFLDELIYRFNRGRSFKPDPLVGHELLKVAKDVKPKVDTTKVNMDDILWISRFPSAVQYVPRLLENDDKAVRVREILAKMKSISDLKESHVLAFLQML